MAAPVAAERSDVQKPVPGEIEQDDRLAAVFPRPERFLDRGRDRVRGLRRREDLFGPHEERGRIEDRFLIDRPRLGRTERLIVAAGRSLTYVRGGEYYFLFYQLVR